VRFFGAAFGFGATSAFAVRRSLSACRNSGVRS
jgi:hypothetical protein